ncbi:hypothetical protein [Jeotgalibacillus marinus]|uniref:DUF4203 domain-containing protein n=1 Tax=Jeotgalibacillus marinus TaxID=86667 RepID=A0ABV3Q3R8_9BACL
MELALIIIGFIFLVVIALFALLTLGLSFKKENCICCLAGGILLGVTAIAIGVFDFVIFFADQALVPIFTNIIAVVFLLIALFLSLLILLSTKKKREFCCLGSGIALTGIGIGTGIIIAVVTSLDFPADLMIALILSIITLAVIIIVAFVVVLLSLKKCTELCCLGGIFALLGVVTGLPLAGGFASSDFELAVVGGSLIGFVIILGILAFLATKSTKKE